MFHISGYINEYGTLNLDRFQAYMSCLAVFDHDQFKDVYADLKYFEGKTGRRPRQSKNLEEFEDDDVLPAASGNSDLAALIKSTDQMVCE